MVFQASSLTTLRSSIPGSLAVPESMTLIGIPTWDSRADANLCLFPARPNVRLPAHTRVRACPWTEMPCGVRRRRRFTGKGASVLCSDCWDLVNGAPAPVPVLLRGTQWAPSKLDIAGSPGSTCHSPAITGEGCVTVKPACPLLGSHSPRGSKVVWLAETDGAGGRAVSPLASAAGVVGRGPSDTAAGAGGLHGAPGCEEQEESQHFRARWGSCPDLRLGCMFSRVRDSMSKATKALA